MAKKIIIAGDSLVITSTMKLDDIKLLEKFAPKALCVYEADEDGKKQEVFRVATTSGKGSINKYGASFASCTRDEDKLATITMAIPAGVADVKEYAEDMIGAAVAHLATVEAQAKDAIETVNAQRKALRDSIEVI